LRWSLMRTPISLVPQKHWERESLDQRMKAIGRLPASARKLSARLRTVAG
jgi:hypothetical protein